MAKSKLVAANRKIAEYMAGGYNKIEETVVGGYNKVADAFVDQYLTREGETVADARTRLAEEAKERQEQANRQNMERGIKS